MITLRPAEERGQFDFGWLNTRHSFSFGRYLDPRHHHFRSLRVINEDRVQPGQGFGTHPHRDMEILTWVLSGSLAHADNMDHQGIIRPGDAQRMSAGIGIEHSEFNASDSDPVHFLQIWLFPKEAGGPPDYEHRHFPMEERRNRLRLLASPDGREGSLSWRQDAYLSNALLDPGCCVQTALESGRHGWVQVARGRVNLNGLLLRAGDGAALAGEPIIRLCAEEDAEILFFDLP